MVDLITIGWVGLVVSAMFANVDMTTQEDYLLKECVVNSNEEWIHVCEVYQLKSSIPRVDGKGYAVCYWYYDNNSIYEWSNHIDPYIGNCIK